MSRTSLRTGRITQLSRGIRLIGKLCQGFVLCQFVFCRIEPSRRDLLIERWCREVLNILSIRVTMLGQTPSGKISPVLFVANHISWADILVLNANRRVRFVAKAEVRQWPVIGWMAAQTGTLFLKRTSLHQLAHVVETATTCLRRGDCVACFPEGTTSDGTSVQTFHSGLFESAIAARALIWPVGISYHRDDGSVDTDLAFLGSQSLVASLMNVLTRPATQVRLSFASPVDSSAGDRYRLAESCRRAVEQSLVAHRKLVAPCRMPTGAHSEEPFSLLTSA